MPPARRRLGWLQISGPAFLAPAGTPAPTLAVTPAERVTAVLELAELADAPTLPDVVITAPSWWSAAGCRRRTPRTRLRCIRIRGHRGGCLPVPIREYRRARGGTW
jgi:hypothetical protein